MNDAIRHYDELLAEHYSWMVGQSFAQKTAEQAALLMELGLAKGVQGLGVDLGSGPGYQSAALADLGFAKIIALDTSKPLLDELMAHKGVRPIEPVQTDLRDLSNHVLDASANAIVCMGDVLTHLQSRADVSRLLADSFRALKPGGRLILTFRDLSQELRGLDRFIPVRSDPDKVMICVLEYEPQTVLIHDLIHVREASGWTMRKSCYRKLRVAPESVAAEMKALGFDITFDGPAGHMWAISGAKPG